MEIDVKMMNKNNEFTLQVKQNNCEEAIKLTLTAKTTDNCFKCLIVKEIRLISERKLPTGFYQEKKFCWGCALTNLHELENGNYELANKQEIINELRTELNNHE